MKTTRPKPGLPVSAAVHAGLLLATLLVFSDARKFDDAQETVPIDIVTDSQINEVMKGEKTAKKVEPAQRADKRADTPETKPLPPLAEAKRDISPPPPQLKRLQEEPQDKLRDKPEAPPPPKRVAALPPVPAPEPPTRPTPPKPEPAKAQPTKSEPPKAPAKPTPAPPEKPPEKEPEEAEVVRPTPPTRPRPEAKPDKPEKPDKPVKQAKEEPPQPPDRAKPKEKRLEVDEVAKLLERKKATEKAVAGDQTSETKSDKPAAKPKSGDETAPKSKFDAASIANLLSREAPQRRAATGKEPTKTASLGAPTANAARMSPTMQAQIDAYTVEHYRKCWQAALAMDARAYVPRVEFHLTRQGALEGPPRLLNPSSDPVERSRGEQALGAVRRCSPMPILPAFDTFYDYWRVTELDMREDM